MAAPQISALPTPPARSQPSTFVARADAFLGALPSFRTQANSLAEFVNSASSEVSDNKQITIAARDAAINAANASRWRPNTAYSAGEVVYSPKTFQTFRAQASQSGTNKDPSEDATNWVQLSISGTAITRSGGEIDDGELIIRQASGSNYPLTLGNDAKGEMRFHTGDTAFMFVRRKNGVTDWGSALTHNNSDGKWRIGSGSREEDVVLTQENADDRYPVFDGVQTTVNGPLSVWNNIQFRRDGIAYVDFKSDQLIFRRGTEWAGRVDAPGVNAPHAQTLITREKGDARYAPIGGSVNFSGGTLTQPGITMAGLNQVGFFNDGNGEWGYARWGTKTHQFTTDLRNAASIVTRQLGDGRYMGKSGGEMNGSLSVINQMKIVGATSSNSVYLAFQSPYDGGSNYAAMYAAGDRSYFEIRKQGANSWESRLRFTGNDILMWGTANAPQNTDSLMTMGRSDGRYFRKGDWNGGQLRLEQSNWNTALTLRNPNGELGTQLEFQLPGTHNHGIELRSGGLMVRNVSTNTEIARFEGAGSDVLNNAVAVVTKHKGDARYSRLGVGDDWVDRSGSRSGFVSYRNVDGKPIGVCVELTGNSNLQVSSNGSNWVTLGWSSGGKVIATVIVPDGHYYRVGQDGTFGQWSELR